MNLYLWGKTHYRHMRFTDLWWFFHDTDKKKFFTCGSIYFTYFEEMNCEHNHTVAQWQKGFLPGQLFVSTVLFICDGFMNFLPGLPVLLPSFKVTPDQFCILNCQSSKKQSTHLGIIMVVTVILPRCTVTKSIQYPSKTTNVFLMGGACWSYLASSRHWLAPRWPWQGRLSWKWRKGS